jgi:hypothetical protein
VYGVSPYGLDISKPAPDSGVELVGFSGIAKRGDDDVDGACFGARNGEVVTGRSDSSESNGKCPKEPRLAGIVGTDEEG